MSNYLQVFDTCDIENVCHIRDINVSLLLMNFQLSNLYEFYKKFKDSKYCLIFIILWLNYVCTMFLKFHIN